MNILIYGAPGAGKTTTGRALQKQTGLELLEGDYLCEVVARGEKTEEEDPFLYCGTKQAWRKFGDLNEENVYKGLFAVRNSMKPYVTKELAKHDSLILEASFLDPTAYKDEAKLFLLVTHDEDQHRKQFFKTRRENQETQEGFAATRIIQNYLVEEAAKLPVIVIENGLDIESVAAQLKSHL